MNAPIDSPNRLPYYHEPILTTTSLRVATHEGQATELVCHLNDLSTMRTSCEAHNADALVLSNQVLSGDFETLICTRSGAFMRKIIEPVYTASAVDDLKCASQHFCYPHEGPVSA